MKYASDELVTAVVCSMQNCFKEWSIIPVRSGERIKFINEFYDIQVELDDRLANFPNSPDYTKGWNSDSKWKIDGMAVNPFLHAELSTASGVLKIMLDGAASAKIEAKYINFIASTTSYD